MEKARSSSASLNATNLTLLDLEERMRMVMMINGEEEDHSSDTFAQRAEEYYMKRPQLLALLQDLYNGYMTLSGRSHQTKHKSLIPHSQQQDEQVEGSETESTLSYQPLLAQNTIADDLVAEIVMKNVENYMLLDQVGNMNQQQNESLQKVELLKMLLELLDSERMMLLDENTRLGYKMNAILEEKNIVASEAMFMKRKATELARCLLRMRDDYRTCILRQRIEDLQEKIFFLEKRNKEYSVQLKTTEQKEVKKPNNKRRSRKTMWEKVKNAELFMCGGFHHGCSS